MHPCTMVSMQNVTDRSETIDEQEWPDYIKTPLNYEKSNKTRPSWVNPIFHGCSRVRIFKYR